MKTFLLIGLVQRPAGGLFPKPLMAVQAENLEAAAGKIGGHVHPAAADAGAPFSALFAPDFACGEFHAGPGTGDALVRALSDSLDQKLSAEDEAQVLIRGSQTLLKMFSSFLLGQMPVAG
ncbi:MAG TPA: hypothetical protein VL426_04075 [Candidatus Binatia bacterium]|jgi:hypothetical protein|nr:hypothetical protein [Candidatus Binatia bacterium]